MLFKILSIWYNENKMVKKNTNKQHNLNQKINRLNYFEIISNHDKI